MRSPSPPPPQPIPTVDDPSVEEARRRARLAAQARFGRRSTILTSGLGLPDTGNTTSSTLLGE